MEQKTRAFDRFAAQKNVVLTTYRRNGTPVPTVVHIVVDGDRAYFRTPSTAGKVKRLRRNADVEIAPSTFGGKVVGPSMRARPGCCPRRRRSPYVVPWPASTRSSRASWYRCCTSTTTAARPSITS